MQFKNLNQMVVKLWEMQHLIWEKCWKTLQWVNCAIGHVLVHVCDLGTASEKMGQIKTNSPHLAQNDGHNVPLVYAC